MLRTEESPALKFQPIKDEEEDDLDALVGFLSFLTVG